ncbi:hypothetical protein PUN71_002130 [Arthrobacter sp. NQ7]|uniref:hypothetical protein n=1 Tax=Arthrobacter sp. NQ7 TaxID=3032303 RepID=UPI0024105498|nr:hypothetical protein [Arthrobacter sp. NQ7]MDJ0455998.1 hypothetical protein [Arthrobacter sp. NQ7]
MKGWVHPTVRRGTIYWNAQAVGFTGLALVLIFFAVQAPTAERFWWAGLAVIAAILFWFLARKMIKDLQHEFRYEDDEDAEKQT